MKRSSFYEKLGKLSRLEIPFSASLELTSVCNLSCGYCFVKKDGSELNTSQLKSVIDRIDQTGSLSLLITGGEPFLRGDVTEILEHVFSRGFYKVGIFSNGTLLNEEHVVTLIKNAGKLNLFRISFFSHLPQVHDQFVGLSGAFRKSLENAEWLLKEGLPVSVTVNAIEENVDEMKETVEFFRSKGFKTGSGVFKYLTDENLRTQYGNTTSREFYDRYFTSMYPAYKSSNISKCDLYNECGTDKGVTNLCNGVFCSVAVRSNGDVVPCLTFRDKVCGNVLKDQRSLTEIIKKSEMYHTLQNFKRSDIIQCKNCPHINSCFLCPGIIGVDKDVQSIHCEQVCNFTKAGADAFRRK